MTDPDLGEQPELDARILGAARLDRAAIDRITAGMPDLSKDIMAAAAEEADAGEDEEAGTWVGTGTGRKRRSPWLAVVGIAAGVALIAVAITAVVENVADSPATGPGPVPAVSSSMSAPGTATISSSRAQVSGTGSTAAPELPMPQMTILSSAPVVPEDGLTQQERNVRRAALTPYFRQLVTMDGFVDGNFDLAASTLRVAFQDAVPAAAQALAAQATSEGASVVLEAVPFSEQQMMAVAGPLSAALRAAGIQGYATPAEDFRSIEISTVFLAETPELQQKVGRVAAPFVGQIPLTLYSVRNDGTVNTMEQPDPPDFDRPAWEARSRVEQSPGWTEGRFDMNARYELVLLDEKAKTAETTAAIDALEKLGVVVVVKPADGPRAYAIADIENVLTNVVMYMPGHDFKITVFGPTPDLTGIEIGGPTLSVSTEEQAAFLAAAKEFGYGYIPITYVPAELAPGQVKSAVQQRVEDEQRVREMQAEADPYWQQISKLKGFRDGGYGAEGPAGAQKVTLSFQWEGKVPQEAKDLAAQAEAQGIKVTFVISKYTEDEIMEAAYPLVDELQRRKIDIFSIGPSNGYTGLRLGGPDLSYSKDLQAQVREIAKDYLGDMPLSFDDKSDDVQNMIDGILPTGG